MAKIEYGILSGKIDVIAAVPVSFIIAITTTIIPVVAEKNRNFDRIGIAAVVQKYIKYTFFIIIPSSVYLFTFSDNVLNLLFNTCSGSILLKINAIALIFIALEQIINSVLQGIGKIFVPAYALGIGVGLKCVLNVMLLKLPQDRYFFAGINGCCIATLVCHIVAFAIVFKALEKNLKIKLKIFKFLLKPVIASCIMAVTLKYAYFFMSGIIMEKVAIILSSLVAVTVYIIFAFALKIVDKNDILCVNIQNQTKKGKKRRILYNFGE